MKSIITSVCSTICAQRCAECINSCLAKRSAAEETSKQTRQHRHSYTAAAPALHQWPLAISLNYFVERVEIKKKKTLKSN